jgi:hypothetical protein
MGKVVLDIFYENWDGDMVLSETSNFINEEDFLEQARKYVNETRGYNVPVARENVEVVTIIVNDEGEWHSKMIAEEDNFKGRELTVYKTDLDWDSVNI